MDMIFGLKSLKCDTDGALARLGGDCELYKSLINRYLASLSFQTLLDAVKASDCRTAFSEAHTMKGVFGNLGITPLYTRACTLSNIFRDGKTAGTDEIICDMIEIKDEIDALVKASD